MVIGNRKFLRENQENLYYKINIQNKKFTSVKKETFICSLHLLKLKLVYMWAYTLLLCTIGIGIVLSPTSQLIQIAATSGRRLVCAWQRLFMQPALLARSKSCVPLRRPCYTHQHFIFFIFNNSLGITNLAMQRIAFI